MQRNIQYVITGILFAGVNLTSLAQRPFTHYYHEEFVQVTNLSQDSSGYLWIGSSELGRFDGYNLVKYRDSTGAPKVEVLSADEQFLVKVKEVILGRLSDEQLSVESLAEDIGMSGVQLYRKVSALTGMSVNELIRKLRLQKAAMLLGQNWGPVSQVAYEVGFSNLSYFSKVFKEEFGVLPSEYVGKA